MFPHRSLEGTGPRYRGGLTVLIRVLIHVERVDVSQREAFFVDRLGRQLVLRHRAARKDRHKLPTLVTSRAKSADKVVGKSSVEGVDAVNHLDAKGRIGVFGNFGARNRAYLLTHFAVAEGDEFGEPIVKGLCRCIQGFLLREASGGW